MLCTMQVDMLIRNHVLPVYQHDVTMMSYYYLIHHDSYCTVLFKFGKLGEIIFHEL